MTDRELMQMAMETIQGCRPSSKSYKQMRETVEALRDRLAQDDLAEAIKKGTKAWEGVDPTKFVEELRGDGEVLCKTHPDAPHGFDRNASLSEDRYVCECESWEPPEPYDQTALELCDVCGWKTVIPDEGCLNCKRLAQTEQEPVAWGIANTRPTEKNPLMMVMLDEPKPSHLVVPLYTAPPKREWVGLTDEDIQSCPSWCGDQHDFAYEIEAKLKEKNT